LQFVSIITMMFFQTYQRKY